MSTIDPGNEGQALVEFCGVFCLVFSLVIGIELLFVTQWRRVQCAYLTFEETHRASIGVRQWERSLFSSVKIQEIGGFFRGVGRCGGMVETVELPELEAGSWQ